MNYKRKLNAQTTWICPNCSAANLYDTKTKIKVAMIVIVSNHPHVTVSAHPTMETEITVTSSLFYHQPHGWMMTLFWKFT